MLSNWRTTPIKYNPTTTTLQKTYRNRYQQDAPFQLSTYQRCLSSNKYHDNHPKEINPGIIPQEKILQIYTDKNSWIIIRSVPITAGFSKPVLNFQR